MNSSFTSLVASRAQIRSTKLPSHSLVLSHDAVLCYRPEKKADPLSGIILPHSLPNRVRITRSIINKVQSGAKGHPSNFPDYHRNNRRRLLSSYTRLLSFPHPRPRFIACRLILIFWTNDVIPTTELYRASSNNGERRTEQVIFAFASLPHIRIVIGDLKNGVLFIFTEIIIAPAIDPQKSFFYKSSTVPSTIGSGWSWSVEDFIFLLDRHSWSFSSCERGGSHCWRESCEAISTTIRNLILYIQRYFIFPPASSLLGLLICQSSSPQKFPSLGKYL
ncbi:uncharacterized protein G2W53_003952 [Senna tora]|uniref:Uncharacterized protein n=1 Tax=Senna tora TaxID=362788 RepID=A0A834XCC4_9FABA|nr:uncharacterized protein G2W53_003952 [Senna tora]